MKNKRASSAKQKLQKELLKKPKVSREFKRVLPAAVLIMVFVGCIITLIFASFFRNEAMAQMDNGREWLENHWNSAANSEKVDFNNKEELPRGAYAKLGWNTDRPAVLNDDSELGVLYELYQCYRIAMGDKLCLDYSYKACYNFQGELITEQDPDIYMFVPHEPDENGVKEPTDMYILDKEAFNRVYPGDFAAMVSEADERLNMYRNTEIRFTDIYVKGDYVLPKRLEVVLTGNYYGSEMEEEMLLADYDFSDYDFSDYEYVAKRKGEDIRILGPILVGNVWDNNPHKAYLDSISEEKMKRCILTAVDEQLDEIVSADSLFRYAGVCFFRSDSTGVVTVTAVDYDFWAAWWPLMLVIYVILLVVSLIVALIWALINFNRKNISYEVYNQRREMTNAMAHDLKSPLMVISGYAENIGDGSDSEKAAANAMKICETVKQMDRMIVNILDMAKLEDENYKLHIEEIDLASLVQKSIGSLEKILSEKQMKVTVSGTAILQADSGQMSRLIDNLLTNAIKYGTEKSEILVDISDKKMTVKNAFDYTLEQDVSKLTKPFVKGNNARGSIGGNGLGLSIVEGIAQAHDFSVKIHVVDNNFEVEIIFS